MKMMLGNVDIFNRLKTYLSLLFCDMAKKFDQSKRHIGEFFFTLAKTAILILENNEQQCREM